jgi:hypothetical protein
VKTGIPKRIIQMGCNDLPLVSKAAAANVRLLNPEFEYLFFDDKSIEDFIHEQAPEYQRAFYSYCIPIQRLDFFRYLAVYHFGGFYFDLDVFLASSLTELLDFECVFPFEELTINMYLRREHEMDWEIGNYAFGATSGHPFVLAIIENCIRAQKEPEWLEVMMASIPRVFREEFYVLNSTGPGLVSRTLAEFPNAAKQLKVLFPENVCDSTKWHLFGEFGVHLMKGTWRKPKGFFKRQLAKMWEVKTRKGLLKESQRLGTSRSLECKRKTDEDIQLITYL